MSDIVGQTRVAVLTMLR